MSAAESPSLDSLQASPKGVFSTVPLSEPRHVGDMIGKVGVAIDR
jgi:hypothetical protein